MASTYSPLKIELIGTGEQAGTWGTTTNTNLGTALEEAITGRATATFPSDANYTLTYTDSNSSQVFRNLVLNVTSSGNLSATRDLIIPAIEKQYIVENNTSGSQSIRVKTSAGNGVTIPNGRIANVFCDGTNTRFSDDYVALNAGTVGLPSLTTTSDTDTGLYFPAANQVALTANGTQVLRASHDGTTGAISVTGDISVSGSLTSDVKIGNGTVSSPSLAAASDTNTGLYFPAADQVALTANGTQVLRVSHDGTTGTTTATGDVSISGSVTSVLKITDGSVSAPALAAASDTNTGIYFPSDLDTNVAISLNGEKAFEIESLVYLGETIMGSQTFGLLASAPDENGLITCGRYDSVYGGSAYNTSGGATFMAFQIEDTEKMRIQSNGDVGVGLTNPTSKMHIFNSGADAFYNSTSNSISCSLGASNAGQVLFTGAPSSNMAIGTTNEKALSFATNGTVRINISSAGSVAIATSTSATERFIVNGIGSTSSTSAAWIRNSSSTELFRVRDDGVFYTGAAALSPYNNTTGSAANVFVGASGDLYRSTSSIRYKKDVTDYDKGLNAVMALRPVYYKDNRTDENKVAGDQTYAGLIAEEVHTAGLGEFVQYNLENEPDALSYGNMVALLTKAIQELKAELDAVKAELAAMKGN